MIIGAIILNIKIWSKKVGFLTMNDNAKAVLSLPEEFQEKKWKWQKESRLDKREV